MDKVFAETFPSGSVKSSITSITLVNNTSKTQDIVVPSDCVWVLESVRFTNPDNVDRSVNVKIFKEAAKTNELAFLFSATVTAGSVGHYPAVASNVVLGHTGYPLTLGAGYVISVTWAAGGVSAGGTDADGLTIMYRELSLT